jgi:imidazolonepropionase-like amidohydrolase
MSIVYRHAAVVDVTGDQLLLDQTLCVDADELVWLGPDDAAPSPPEKSRVIDAGGATVVPGAGGCTQSRCPPWRFSLDRARR